MGAEIDFGFFPVAQQAVMDGGGVAVRAAMHIDDVVDAVRAADNVVDTVNELDTAVDAQKTAGNLSSAGDIAGALCSFSADTPVTTEEGETEISAIEIGDTVLA